MDRNKMKLVQENRYHCSHGRYKQMPNPKSLKSFYTENMNISPPYMYCNVDVSNKHPVDVAYEYRQKNSKTVIINTVFDDFAASNLDKCELMKDTTVMVRTNYVRTLMNNYDLFPLNAPDVIYAPHAYIIRSTDLVQVAPRNAIRTAIMTVPLKEHKGDTTLEFYQLMSQVVDTIFQTAMKGEVDTIILNDLGTKTDGYDVSDLCRMINSSIFRYGHMFKNVIIALNVRTNHPSDMGYSNKFNELLIRPQNYYIEYIQQEQREQQQLLAVDNDKEEEKKVDDDRLIELERLALQKRN